MTLFGTPNKESYGMESVGRTIQKYNNNQNFFYPKQMTLLPDFRINTVKEKMCIKKKPPRPLPPERYCQISWERGELSSR